MDPDKTMLSKLEFSPATYLQIQQRLSAIDGFRGSWKVTEHPDSAYLKELRTMATVQSIGSSTRIEGSTLTDQEVAQLLKSVKIERLTTRDQQEVVGYYDALQVIMDNYADMDVAERYIHQLHGILLNHSAKDQQHKGKYKTLSNQVMATYPDGTQRIIFRTTEPHLTAKEMESLVAWTNERLRATDMHPVLITAAFVYEFLSIHPYQDGNGRLSRLLTTLLMMKQGYHFVQYISFEHIIEERKEEYYRTLVESQKNRASDKERLDSWMLFFLDCIIILVKRLEAKYELYSKVAKELNDRQRKVLQYIKKHKTVQISAIDAAFEQYSRNTLKKDLAYLTNEGLLIRTGERKGSRYHYKE